MRSTVVTYPEDQPTPWGFLGGHYQQTTKRFCVLDGPMAGTCWEATSAHELSGARITAEQTR